MDLVVPYKVRLDADRNWALWQGSMHFERANYVWNTLRTVTGWLGELAVDYVVIGGLAMFLHGYRRFSEDVDILVTEDGLRTVQAALPGWGFQTANSSGTHIRDVETGVRVEFRVSGRFPGDGMPKPVTFPDPATVATHIEGVQVITLPALLDIKLASGLSSPLRRRDLADAQEIVAVLELTEGFAPSLHPFVREEFCHIVQLIREAPVPPDAD